MKRRQFLTITSQAAVAVAAGVVVAKPEKTATEIRPQKTIAEAAYENHTLDALSYAIHDPGVWGIRHNPKTGLDIIMKNQVLRKP